MHTGSNPLVRHRRWTGLACGLGAVTLGLIYLVVADAPLMYVIGNVCGTMIGVGCFFVASKLTAQPNRMNRTWWLFAVLLLAATLLGTRVEGAARWVRLGSLMLQPSLIVVPAMVVAFARRRSVVSTLSIIIAALLLALQPDRAMAAVLASGTVLLALRVRERFVVAAALAGIASLAITFYRADKLPAVPYVDRILFTSFDVNAMIGCAVVLGVVLLLVPGVLTSGASRTARDATSVFSVMWLTIIAAAALGNYPTPIVGYGGSAIVGYFLSIAFLPQHQELHDLASAAHQPRDPHRDGPDVVRDSQFHIRADRALAAVRGTYTNSHLA